MLAERCIRIAGLYLLVGMAMGIAMGATGNFSLRPVHAHVNLLGWVGLAVTAGVFKLWPAIAESRLARVFFWTYNIALPALLIALSLFLLGHTEALPIMVAAEIAVFGAAALFVVSLIRVGRVRANIVHRSPAHAQTTGAIP